MITISILGLDQYAIGTYSAEHTKNLANLFEVKTSDISFYAPNCFMYHEGIDQTSWNTLIRVHAPRPFEKIEDKITSYLFKTLADVAINIAVEFYYYEQKNRHEHINKEYPRFITDANAVVVDDEHNHDDEHDHDDDDELFEGNIFEGIEDIIK
ncbi:MAG: hypothetical protein PHD98_03035 [Bacilli bacterium]|jgi:hypothetical protein|nr:hypothetical protein [Bacilli bacterium]MDD4006124.1 hypothetical protein [Bacilli bacterium]